MTLWPWRQPFRKWPHKSVPNLLLSMTMLAISYLGLNSLVLVNPMQTWLVLLVIWFLSFRRPQGHQGQVVDHLGDQQGHHLQGHQDVREEPRLPQVFQFLHLGSEWDGQQMLFSKYMSHSNMYKATAFMLYFLKWCKDLTNARIFKAFILFERLFNTNDQPITLSRY